MGAIDLVQALIAEGVEFVTDGQRIRWRNSGGRMTPERVAELAAAKADVIDFLTRVRHPDRPSARCDGLHPDAEALLDFLRREGPHTYGAAASTLGWGATRTWQAEERLREAGLVRHGAHGQAVLTGERDRT